ncbi:MAG: response regulator [Lachnospiraceae bacterium]
MRKVLLIGCLNKTLGGIKDCLEDDYRVQLCSEKLDSVKDMVCLIKPDLIIVSQVGMVDEDVPIFELFEKRYLRTPILVVALKELENHFSSLLLTDRKVMVVYRPVTKSKILDTCNKLLKNNTAESLPDDENISRDMKDTPHIEARNDDSENNIWKHILVVDDNMLVLRNVRRLLEKKYQVSIAKSGEQAISLMEKIKMDLVLLDYEMPGWDGKKTLEAMRQNPDLAEIPVVFLTGISERDHIMKVLLLNPAGYLLKPTNQEKLIETIESVLQGSHAN